eukprot:scaffold130902_cov30-Tisochrysis_lutea.AAC.3
MAKVETTASIAVLRSTSISEKASTQEKEEGEEKHSLVAPSLSLATSDASSSQGFTCRRYVSLQEPTAPMPVGGQERSYLLSGAIFSR